MRQLTTSTTYNHTIVILPTNAFYSRPCSFHTFYENHESNDLQILSIKSCAYHHKEENFKVIMSYNPSTFYAMIVTELSKKVVAK